MLFYFLRLYIFSLDDGLLDRLGRIAANPFQDWSYSNLTSATAASSKASSDSVSSTTSLADAVSQNIKPPEIVLNFGSAARGGPCISGRKKRVHSLTTSSEIEVKKSMIESKHNKEKGKEDKSEKEPKDQISLQELYYATMEGNGYSALKESKTPLHFRVRLKIFLGKK